MNVKDTGGCPSERCMDDRGFGTWQPCLKPTVKRCASHLVLKTNVSVIRLHKMTKLVLTQQDSKASHFPCLQLNSHQLLTFESKTIHCFKGMYNGKGDFPCLFESLQIKCTLKFISLALC